SKRDWSSDVCSSDLQDYEFEAGDPLSDVDVHEHRPVAILGFDVGHKLFDTPALAIGQKVRIHGQQFTVKGVIAKKGTVLGQSWRSEERRVGKGGGGG